MCRKILCSILILALLYVGLSSLQPNLAFAIPTFSRTYRTSCITCHSGMPKLNAFGEAFRNQGYRMPDNEVFVKEEPVELGAEAYKRVWPNAVWPGTIPSNVPISLRVEQQFVYTQLTPSDAGGRSGGKGNFEFPHEIEFLSAGNFGNDFSFFISYAIQDEDERSAIERVWLEWNDLFARFGVPEDLLNLRIGLIDIAAMPFSTHNQRLLLSIPAIYNFRVSSADQPRLRDSQPGLELYGIAFDRFRYALGVVNGDAEDTAMEAFRDSNSQKDVYYRLEYKFGGIPFSGAPQAAKAETSSLAGPAYFDSGPSVTVGHTGYYGVNQLQAVVPKADSEYYRFTGFGRATWGRFSLDGVFLAQHDDSAAGQFLGTIRKSIDSWGYYFEGNVFIFPWLVLTGRADYLEVDHNAVLGAANPTDDISRLSLGGSIYLRPNIRLVPEAQFAFSDHRDNDSSDAYLVRLDFLV